MKPSLADSPLTAGPPREWNRARLPQERGVYAAATWRAKGLLDLPDAPMARGRFCGLNRLCENFTTALAPEKPTSTDSIGRVLPSGKGSDAPFFILQKQRFEVFTQSVKAVLLGRRAAAVMALVAVLVGIPPCARAQVIFIDADQFAAAAATSGVVLPAGGIGIQVTIVRFVPKNKATGFQDANPFQGSPKQVVESLGKLGQVNVLFSAGREVNALQDGQMRFYSVERKPAFSMDSAANAELTNRFFGLDLAMKARLVGGEQSRLDWEGNFSWSPTLIDPWAGEKYLLFGMRVASILKPGSVYETKDDDDTDSGEGINLRKLGSTFGSLFKRKPKNLKDAAEQLKANEKKPVVVPTVGALMWAERHEVPLRGIHTFRLGENLVQQIPVVTDPKEPEFLYVIFQPSRVD